MKEKINEFKIKKKMNESISFHSFIFSFTFFLDEEKESQFLFIFFSKILKKQNVLFVFPNNPDGIEKTFRKNLN